MSTAADAYGCPYCGSTLLHLGVCPMVKAIEYHVDGTVKRVELVRPEPHNTALSPFDKYGDWL